MSNENDVFLIIKNDEIEMDILKEFFKDHSHKDVNFGAIGGHIQYILTVTSIGPMCSVKCTHCDTEKNITNYDIF